MSEVIVFKVRGIGFSRNLNPCELVGFRVSPIDARNLSIPEFSNFFLPKLL